MPPQLKVQCALLLTNSNGERSIRCGFVAAPQQLLPAGSCSYRFATAPVFMLPVVAQNWQLITPATAGAARHVCRRRRTRSIGTLPWNLALS